LQISRRKIVIFHDIPLTLTEKEPLYGCIRSFTRGVSAVKVKEPSELSLMVKVHGNSTLTNSKKHDQALAISIRGKGLVT
ncbi:MAG: hypothetical protein U0L43_10950, partial [Muribaculaceae bacterium]|nr:hypothetical protein [Muribaculaceae bacterium]